jgi:signal transduction histidine kinase
MLGVLRRVDEGPPRSPAAGLAGLDELAERVRGGGTPVTIRRVGPARPLPAAVDAAAFRIVQEALTNVHRHAHATNATVLVDYTGSDLVVQVDDDGRGPAGPAVVNGGNGIPGMRERTAALGGRLSVGPRPGRGFRVRAVLPTSADITTGGSHGGGGGS